MISLVPASDDDRDLIRAMLEQAKLPTDILESRLGMLWIARDNESTAVGGFEFYSEDALLRSVVVDQAHRSTGIGTRMVEQLLELAAQRKVRRVWLLTETAEGFFAKRGFTTIDRASITNKDLLGSPEFTHVCSKTAVCMVREVRALNRS